VAKTPTMKQIRPSFDWNTQAFTDRT